MSDDEEGIPNLAQLVHDAFTMSDEENDCDLANEIIKPNTNHGLETSKLVDALTKLKERSRSQPDLSALTDEDSLVETSPPLRRTSTRQSRRRSRSTYKSAPASPTGRESTSISNRKLFTPFKCDMCEHITNSKNSLEDHKRTHTGERPFQCAFCTYACNVVSNLKRHVQVRHLVHDDSDSVGLACAYCDFTTSESSDLRYHVRKCAREGRKVPFKTCAVSEKFEKLEILNVQPNKILLRRKSMPACKIGTMHEPNVHSKKTDQADKPMNILPKHHIEGKCDSPEEPPAKKSQPNEIAIAKSAEPTPPKLSPMISNKMKFVKPFLLKDPPPLTTKPSTTAIRVKPLNTLLQKGLPPPPPLKRCTPIILNQQLLTKQQKLEKLATSKQIPAIVPLKNGQSLLKSLTAVKTMPKRVWCTECDFNTNDAQKWQQHKRAGHADCRVCHSKFTSTDVLEIHTDVRHSIPLSAYLPHPIEEIDISAIKLTTSKSMRFLCKLCGFQTYQIYEFDAHEQRHLQMDGWSRDQRMTFDIISLNGEIVEHVVNYSCLGIE